MDCKTALAQIDAYLDGELDRAASRALEAHLDACPACAAAMAGADALRRSLHDPSLRHAAPEALRARVQATLAASRSAGPAERSARRRMSRPAWWQLAAACVLAFAAGVVAPRLQAPSDAPPQLAQDLFASHWRALAANSPVDVVSSDHHTVKPWFAGKVADSPPVQDFAAQGFALVGARIDYAGSQRLPVLVYRHGAHVIDVFVLPQGATASLAAHAESHGYSADTVMLGPQPAVMVTDMDAGERSRLAGLLRGAR